MQAGEQLFYLGASHVAGHVNLENQFNNVNYQSWIIKDKWTFVTIVLYLNIYLVIEDVF